VSRTSTVELVDVAARLRERIHTEDPELEPLVVDARVMLSGARPLGAVDATENQRGLLLTLELSARALGTALASPSIQDRLTSAVAAAVSDDSDEALLDLSFAWRSSPAAPPSHPYRHPGDAAGPCPAPRTTLDEATRELLTAYFAARAAHLAWESHVVADEVVVTIFADSMIFSSLSGPLRDALRRIAPKVLLERRSG